jgi:sugar phosphate isomerase/epimerase
MVYTRRDFGKLALAALPLAEAYAAVNSKFKGVQIGAITYSFGGGTPAVEMIPALVTIGIGEVELMSDHCESLAGAPALPSFGRGRGPGGPPPGAGGPPPGGPPPGAGAAAPGGPPPGGGAPGAAGGRGGRGGRGFQMTPEQQEAMKKAQDDLKNWRMSTTPATFKAVRKKFDDAGIDLRILCFNQRITATDDDIEYAFQMAKALDVKAISSSSTVSFAKRAAPFADKHKMIWAGHGHDNVNDPEEFSTPKSFETIMSFSKYIYVNLDVGHFTAAGFDAVPYIKQIHGRISNLHLKDRKKPVEGGGRPANLPWGQADTPIKDVLELMSKEKYPFPANIELEYPIPEGSDRITELKKCLQYCKDALA